MLSDKFKRDARIAHDVCKKAGFVSDFFQHSKRGDSLFAILPKGAEKCISMHGFWNDTVGQLTTLRFKGTLKDEMILKICAEANSNFGDLANSCKQDEFAYFVIVMALIHEILELERLETGLILQPPTGRYP